MAARSWHSIDVQTALQELRVDPRSGLPAAEARTRLEKYGPNELTQETRTSPLALFFNQFNNILIVILLVATVLSALVGEYIDAVIIFARGRRRDTWSP